MDNKILHNLKDIPFNERETFNNAILLLTMVKSEYYYIVGFSRPDNKIEIGFDFKFKYYGESFEVATMLFSEDPDNIKVICELASVDFSGEDSIPFEHNKFFSLQDGSIQYEKYFKKDNVIPVSIENLNSIILSIKKDIRQFLSDSIIWLSQKQ